MDNQKPKQKRFISIRVKMLVGFSVLMAIIFSGLFFWVFSFSENLALNRIQEDLKDTLEGTANGVNTTELLALVAEAQPNAEGFTDDPRFESQLNWLDQVHQVEPRAWPYIYIKGEEPNEVYFVVDLYARYDPESAGGFLESYISKGSMLGGLESFNYRLTERGQFDTYGDGWGDWVSAYMPITDSKGEQVAAMGIDFKATYVNQVRQSILNQIFIIFGVAYVIVFILVWLVINTITRPVIDLTRTAESIGEGNYEQDLTYLLKGRHQDEIGKLTEVFSTMANKIFQRERKLRTQVEKLQIEISETKRRSQVNEIVETDFFKDLQNRASELRSRRSKTQDEPSDSKPE